MSLTKGPFAWVAAATVALLSAGLAWAQDAPFPAKAVKILVPVGPGGDTDTVARLVADGLASELGQPVFVENKAGAGGQTALKALAASVPDGYTLGMGFQAAVTVVPQMRTEAPYDPVRSFTAIGRVATTGNAVVVRIDSPYRSLTELVSAARSNPGRLTYGHWGIGSGGHLAGELINLQGGVRTVNVPYKGTAEVARALLAGELDFAFLGYGLAQQQVSGGKMRALAVIAPERSSIWPDVPTLKEAGFDITQNGWFGLLAPAGLPEDVRRRLESAFLAASRAPVVGERLRPLGMKVEPIGGAEFAHVIARESESWRLWLERLHFPKN